MALLKSFLLLGQDQAPVMDNRYGLHYFGNLQGPPTERPGVAAAFDARLNPFTTSPCSRLCPLRSQAVVLMFQAMLLFFCILQLLGASTDLSKWHTIPYLQVMISCKPHKNVSVSFHVGVESWP